MALTVSPVIALPSVPGATSGPLLLQPGTVIDARVLQILESGLARIAIAGITLDVASTAALTPGSNLRLAVSQSGSVTQLAILAPGETAPPAISTVTANATCIVNANAGSAAPVTTGAIAQPSGSNSLAATSIEAP